MADEGRRSSAMTQTEAIGLYLGTVINTLQEADQDGRLSPSDLAIVQAGWDNSQRTDQVAMLVRLARQMPALVTV